VCGSVWSRKSDAEKAAIVAATERILAGGRKARPVRFTAAEFEQLARDLGVRRTRRPRRVRAT